jgi:hypothetical protein
MKPKFKVLKCRHLTALDRKLISASINAELQDVYTPQKRLNIICTDAIGNVKANLLTFQHEIGLGAKKSWYTQEIIFKPN